MNLAGRRTYIRDVSVALALFLGLLALTRLQFQPVQIPGYLLMMGFDAPQNALLPGLGGPTYTVLFGLYLVGLAALGGRIAGRLRRRFGGGGRLRYGLGGGVLAVLLILLGAAVVIAVPNARQVPTPVAIALAVGLAGLWLGMRFGAYRDNQS
ncbi:MAG: hypothetical protein ABEH59_07470 [Halobacteriales archaeon]